jgi:hypothetical protein
MSTPYPEIKADESGLVPSQPTVRSEWPKKLRALTQQDLDRLTIDQDGRFYWDGKPVTSATTHSANAFAAESVEPKALEMLDRAALEIAGRKPGAAEPPKGTPDVSAGERAKAVTETKPAALPTPAQVTVPATRVTLGPARKTSIDGRIRIRLTAMQSFGAFIVAVALIVSAIGLAATGWAAAHDWSCQLGWIPAKVCPVNSGPKTPTRTTDIPT